ncbi:N-terminal acetyltransferase A, auxiliary subunit, partial [Aureobasidium melanogenum]
MSVPLSSKEQSLFKQVVQLYESKQYKRGIKTADQVLKKVPNHGDTQAMKALILNSQGKTEEAFDLAKLALKNAMKSNVCWHVYGLLYRSVKNYDEAIKAYKFALRLDPDSRQIQRDLSLLQAQTRDWKGLIDSRRTMLTASSGVRANWTAMAIAHHMAGDYQAAEKVLTMYEDTLKVPPPPTDLEHHEAVLYKNTIIAESGDYERALKGLKAIYKSNPDRTAVMELRAEYLLKLDRKEEAEKAYRNLLERNPERRAYYDGLEKCLGLDRNDSAAHNQLLDLYKSFAEKSERIDAPRRVPLDFLQGNAFREAADAYLTRVF